jgi:hypothetical protein
MSIDHRLAAGMDVDDPDIGNAWKLYAIADTVHRHPPPSKF